MNNIELEYNQDSNELVIRFIKKMRSTKYFYSIYGNTNFNLKGVFDVSNVEQTIPRITIDIGENSIFFIKFKNIVNEKIIEEFKFVELEKLKENQNQNQNQYQNQYQNQKQKQNLSMNILDKKTENLFKSINMDEDEDNDDDEEENSSDNDSDNPTTDNFITDNDSDNPTTDNDISYSDNMQLLNTLRTPINEDINIELLNDNLTNEQIENM